MIVREPDDSSRTEVMSHRGRIRRTKETVQELPGDWEPSELLSTGPAGRPLELDGISRSELAGINRFRSSYF